MINPKELRIGNTIYCVTSKLNVTVSYPHPAQCIVDIFREDEISAEFVHGDLEEFEPIPITPEWLKKLGFEKSNTSPYRDCDAFVIFKDAGRLIWCAGNLFKPTHVSFIKITSYDFLTDPHPIKYIHRLQNAIYFLTGMELKYSLYDPTKTLGPDRKPGIYV
jgi:hypothetical protein